MYKKFFLGFSLVALLSNLSVAYAVDVWSSSNKVTGEWGNVLVNDYVVTDSIQGNSNRFTVNVKHVGDISRNQVSMQEYEFRQKDGLWCFFVKLPSRDAYTPIYILENKSVVSIFDICKNYSSFIAISESDVKAKEAKTYFDKGTKYYFNDKDYLRSADCFTKAIKLYPQYYDAYIRRARSYAGIGDYDNAITDYRYVIDSGKDEYNIARNELQHIMKKKQR